MPIEVPALIPREQEARRAGRVFTLYTSPKLFPELLAKIEAVNESPVFQKMGIFVDTVKKVNRGKMQGIASLRVLFKINFPAGQLNGALEEVLGELRGSVYCSYEGTYLYWEKKTQYFPKPNDVESQGKKIGYTVGLSTSRDLYEHFLRQIPFWNSYEIQKKYPGLRQVNLTNALVHENIQQGEIQLTFMGFFSSALLHYFIEDEINTLGEVKCTYFYPVQKNLEGTSSGFTESPDTIEPSQPSQ